MSITKHPTEETEQAPNPGGAEQRSGEGAASALARLRNLERAKAEEQGRNRPGMS